MWASCPRYLTYHDLFLICAKSLDNRRSRSMDLIRKMTQSVKQKFQGTQTPSAPSTRSTTPNRGPQSSEENSPAHHAGTLSGVAVYSYASMGYDKLPNMYATGTLSDPVRLRNKAAQLLNENTHDAPQASGAHCAHGAMGPQCVAMGTAGPSSMGVPGVAGVSKSSAENQLEELGRPGGIYMTEATWEELGLSLPALPPNVFEMTSFCGSHIERNARTQRGEDTLTAFSICGHLFVSATFGGGDTMMFCDVCGDLIWGIYAACLRCICMLSASSFSTWLLSFPSLYMA